MKNNDAEDNDDDDVPPLSRFLKALYQGLTFPFPTLRQLTLESTSTTADHKLKVKQIGFSLREALFAIAVYLCFGAVSYHSTVLQAHDGTLPWSFIDALYFSVVTFSTVGYGDLCPTSTIGKIFTILFGISGISILGIALSTIGSRLAELESNMVKKARKASRQRLKAFWHALTEDEHFKHLHLGRNNKKAKDDTNSNATPKKEEKEKKTTTTPEPLWRQTLKSIFSKSIPAFAVIVVGGTIMGRVEGWSLLDSIYYAFITAVTLGYGDFSPATKTGRLWAILFIPLAVAAAGEVLGNVATTLQERRQELYYESLMQEELSVDRLLEMDTNRNGKVSREEYVEFMLQEMGLVSEDEFAELHTQFAKLDRDGSGFLDKDDLQERIDKQKGKI